MRDIRLIDVKKTFNNEIILENFNLTIPGGCFFALLGPSGSGKTTILRLIAGFETADEGTIYLGNENITHMPINKRRINTVFQNYALFPHLNVFDNVAYSLKIKGFAKDVIEEKVLRMLKAVHLERHLYKNIKQLSGGQQQRVALARAIINEPEVLLLDEPLAALDQKLRERLLIELVDLQAELKTTFVYVTHDQSEALTVADTIAIMNYDGEIEQIASPRKIYEYPSSSFVANFVGSTNIFTGKLMHRDGKAELYNQEIGSLDVVIDKDKESFIGRDVLMSIRPEKILITKKVVDGFSNWLSGEVSGIIYYGRSTLYNVTLKNGHIVQVFEQNDEHIVQESMNIDYDDKVNLYWQKENSVLLEK